jgi:hypothetical protein
MSKRLLALLLVGLVCLAGFGGLTPPAQTQGPPAGDEPPVRLKKKKPRGEDKPKAKPDEKKKDDKKGEEKPEKKDEMREAEPVTPQEEEKEVLQRVVQNVHKVDDRLAKNDLGEATQQTQRDILKDLDSLIQRNENPPPQGGDQQDQQGGGANQNNKNQKQGKGKAQGKSGTKSKRIMQQRRQRTEAGSENKGGKNGQNGNGGGGGNKDDRNKNADLDKHGVWGHLPATLRAQMDAYSNPHPFMPKYDELIKRYYRTIAEQGRRKGE